MCAGPSQHFHPWPSRRSRRGSGPAMIANAKAAVRETRSYGAGRPSGTQRDRPTFLVRMKLLPMPTEPQTEIMMPIYLSSTIVELSAGGGHQGKERGGEGERGGKPGCARRLARANSQA